MIWRVKKRINKFGAKRSSYRGHVYHSKKERDYAILLDWRLKAGLLKSWKHQVPFKLKINKELICTYIIDFVEEWVDGTKIYTEVKGFDTDVWRLKWKMFEALHPELKKQVVR